MNNTQNKIEKLKRQTAKLTSWECTIQTAYQTVTLTVFKTKRKNKNAIIRNIKWFFSIQALAVQSIKGRYYIWKSLKYPICGNTWLKTNGWTGWSLERKAFNFFSFLTFALQVFMFVYAHCWILLEAVCTGCS